MGEMGTLLYFLWMSALVDVEQPEQHAEYSFSLPSILYQQCSCLYYFLQWKIGNHLLFNKQEVNYSLSVVFLHCNQRMIGGTTWQREVVSVAEWENGRREAMCLVWWGPPPCTVVGGAHTLWCVQGTPVLGRCILCGHMQRPGVWSQLWK